MPITPENGVVICLGQEQPADAVDLLGDDHVTRLQESSPSQARS
jgi:hypothetical protein